MLNHRFTTRKDSVYEDSLSRQNSANVSNYSSQNKGMTMSKDINSVDSDTDSQVKAMNLKEYSIVNRHDSFACHLWVR